VNDPTKTRCANYDPDAAKFHLSTPENYLLLAMSDRTTLAQKGVAGSTDRGSDARFGGRGADYGAYRGSPASGTTLPPRHDILNEEPPTK
jgi:hypothetical protein